MTTPPPPGDMSYPQGDGLVYPASDDDKTMGLIAHVGSIFAGLLAPLLVMLLKKDSPFAQQESKEALNFGILVLIVSIPTCGFAALIGIVFYIIAAVQVSKGQPYRYPINWRIIK